MWAFFAIALPLPEFKLRLTGAVVSGAITLGHRVRSEGLQHRVTLEAGGTRIEAVMPCVGDVLNWTISPAHMHLLSVDDAVIDRDAARLVKPPAISATYVAAHS